MMFKQVLGHASYIGHTGFANHSREFFTALNKLVPVRVRNFSHAKDIDYLTQEQKDMVIKMDWVEPPWTVGTPYTPVADTVDVVLVETNHYYYYDQYTNRAKVAYNIWESTRQPEQFFQQLLTFDQFWAPSEWQVRCTVEQGFPEKNAKVVPCAVDGSIFKPLLHEPKQQDKFRFLLFGRWDHRKSTGEIISSFLSTFQPHENVELVCSIDNGWPTPDGLTDTDSRLKAHGFYRDSRLNVVKFVPFIDYVNYMQNGHVFVSCARSEGWNLPLLEAMACGIPTICSDYGAQLEFASGISHMVRIVDHKPIPANIFVGQDVPGTWAEPDYMHLREVMRDVYENYEVAKARALTASRQVREKFTYQASAQKAVECLNELCNKDPVLVDTKLKLNLGCGDAKLPGFVNIDLYNDYGEPDKRLDARQLPYGQDSVDVIYSSHMLEHLGHMEVESTLQHWLSILKPGGELELHIPNLEYSVTNWLRADKLERQGHALDQIFGRQTYEGEFHKTGFTKEFIVDLLDHVGYGSIHVESEWALGAEGLKVTAIKRASVGREIVIMSAFADTPQKETVLRECFNRIKSVNVPIALVTHHRPRPELAELFDYVIYERENVLSSGWDLNYWFTEPGVVRILGKYGNNSYQPVAIMSSLRMAINALIDRYDTAYFIESDTMVNFVDYTYHTRKAMLNGAKMVAFTYDNDLDDIGTNIMAFDVKWAHKVLPDIHDWQTYLDLSDRMRNAGVYNGDAIFELWFPAWLKYTNAWNKCHVHPKEVKTSVMSKENVIKRELSHDVKVDISETNDGRLVVFLLSYRDTGEIVPCTVYKSSVEIFSGDLHVGKVAWFVIPKELCTVDIWLDGESTRKLSIDPNHDYSATTFKFYRDELICHSWSGGDFGPTNDDIHVSVSFMSGAKVELSGSSTEHYLVEFIDANTGQSVHAGRIKSGYWIAPSPEYLVDWHVKVSKGADCITDAKFDLTGRRVLLSLDSKSLGDTIAWFPYCVEFARVRQCTVVVSTFWNKLFVDAYPTIEFVEPGSVVHNLYAMFTIGCYDDNPMKNRNNWRTIPIQQIASDTLGLPPNEIRPNIGVDKGKRPIQDKYVCISEHSTMQCKYWNYLGGWQVIVEELKARGYEVVVVSRESTQLKGVRRRTGQTIESTINTLAHAEAFIGVSSGPAWLAWALKVPVVMISGFTKQFNEFKSNIARVINEKVCHGCANDPEYPYDRGDWAWCPRGKNFECTKTILPQEVMDKFDWLMTSNKDPEDLFYTPDQPEPIHLDGITGPPTYGYSYTEIFKGQAYEHGDCKVEKGDVVVDCGGNIGVFTRYAQSRGARDVYTFEPEPENYAALVRNVSGALSRRVAIADKVGICDLHLHSVRGGHSLVDNNINGTQLHKSIKVETTTLDDIFEEFGLDRVDYLKIDVEGSELAVFDGLSQENLAKVHKIGMEYHNMIYEFNESLRDALVNRLVNAGFQPMIMFLGESGHLQMLYFWRNV